MYLRCNKLVVRADVGYSESTHVKNTGDLYSVYHNMINSVVSFSIWKQPNSLMNILGLVSGTTGNHISDPGEVLQTFITVV